jgi:hypothetical protein
MASEKIYTTGVESNGGKYDVYTLDNGETIFPISNGKRYIGSDDHFYSHHTNEPGPGYWTKGRKAQARLDDQGKTIFY